MANVKSFRCLGVTVVGLFAAAVGWRGLMISCHNTISIFSGRTGRFATAYCYDTEIFLYVTMTLMEKFGAGWGFCLGAG